MNQKDVYNLSEGVLNSCQGFLDASPSYVKSKKIKLIPQSQNTSVTHNFAFRPDKYSSKTSPGPWKIFAYPNFRFILVWQTQVHTAICDINK